MFVAVVAVFAVLSGCGTSDADASAADSAPPTPPAALDASFESQFPCSPSAYPSDPEFRNLACEVKGLLGSVFRVGVDVDPDWAWRQSEATLLYAQDRGAALQQLRDLIEEMRAAGLD